MSQNQNEASAAKPAGIENEHLVHIVEKLRQIEDIANCFMGCASSSPQAHVDGIVVLVEHVIAGLMVL